MESQAWTQGVLLPANTLTTCPKCGAQTLTRRYTPASHEVYQNGIRIHGVGGSSSTACVKIPEHLTVTCAACRYETWEWCHDLSVTAFETLLDTLKDRRLLSLDQVRIWQDAFYN
ncbi:hypothetical protein SAMN00768000_3679 [Sulfobacillus thermosulfidooxidans DSM 9293]|uniref:Uncharacterized protein n=1 Tax=Sulfobacillus thermosulfidooxidans (strain DSM 9293 / VKM B-1269 / AT-1) TaxID=929705 RepID=A0A1W1WPK9_SULTA|nr:hypothetical protein [Sulfobacillus thermosulfidooxidans]SMC08142.1 hypothetical protein SAMN00768000_3679 [Sulfobacillus thermosulfidooxidans DSM 9293]